MRTYSRPEITAVLRYAVGALWIFLTYFGVEYYAGRYLDPVYDTGLAFGGLWALGLTALVLLLPRLAGRIVYALTFFLPAAFAIGQCGFYSIFGRMMWLGDVRYAGEGGAFLGDVLGLFAPSWWAATVLLLLLGIAGVVLVPRPPKSARRRGICLMLIAAAGLGLTTYPDMLFQKDADAWGLQEEYKRALSREAIYTTMYDAHRLYQICGIYQSMVKDVWEHILYPATPVYQNQIEKRVTEVDDWFDARPAHTENDMSGIFAGKNVVLVLMESMDDWLINETDTPTIARLMDESINFTNFYTPGFGSVRTFNTEFSVNTGMFLPTNGSYSFDYVTNNFSQSLPALFRDAGYSTQAFHYNYPTFYSRGSMEPAMGYEAYNSFYDFGMQGDDLLSDESMFRSDALMEKFYHGEGGSYQGFFNFIISRSAHMTYDYDEELSVFALGRYPEYRGSTPTEEEDCIRAKARCCDELFSALLASLEAEGALEDTVIVAFADHYTYGMSDQGLVMQRSQVPVHTLVERTPCFIWSADGPTMEVDKLLNTSDLLPTLLNLFGLESDYRYLGWDAFDESYEGYVIFQNQNWISNSGLYQNGEVVYTFDGGTVSAEEVAGMNDLAQTYIRTNNLLLESDYYGRDRIKN